MIIANLRDQLGNQLFTYAAIKCICIDRNIKFGWYVTPSPVIFSVDKKYGSTLETAFSIDNSERIADLDIAQWASYVEPWPRKTNYMKELVNVKDGTIVTAHCQAPAYFKHHDSLVRHWFTFSESIREHAAEKYKAICADADGALKVAVHYRGGSDYIGSGKYITPHYYHNAIQLVRKRAPSCKIKYYIFSDVPDIAIKVLGLPDSTVLKGGSLMEDLSLMSHFDAHIIGNSTFGWWGAWLHESGHDFVVRPSIFPVDNNAYYPDDIWPENWMVAEARRAPVSLRLRLQWIRQSIFR